MKWGVVMELWDIYDKYRHSTGKIHQRGITMEAGDYHIVVHIWIINDKNEILVQRRQPWKEGWPNMWDCAAAGSAVLGDDSKSAALREVKEELGIDLDIDNSEIVFTVKFSRGFDDVWLVRQNVEISELKLQYEEVAEAKWVTREEIMEMIQRKEIIPYSYFDMIFKLIDSELSLKKAELEEADELYELQRKVFTPMLRKYEDYEISPATQAKEKFLKRFEKGDYYKILYSGSLAGSVFVYEKEPGIMKFHIINILDEYQNMGIGQEVMKRLESMYPQADSWELETILSEERNCYLYEKMGYIRTEEEKVVNEKMILIGYKKTSNLNHILGM